MLKPWQPVTLTTVSSVALTLLATSHPASAIALRGSVEGPVLQRPGYSEGPLTRFSGTFSLDSNTPNENSGGGRNFGQYRISTFDVSFFDASNAVLGRLTSGSVVFKNSSFLGIINDNPGPRGEGLNLFIGIEDNTGPISIDTLQLAFSLPRDFFSSAALPRTLYIGPNTRLDPYGSFVTFKDSPGQQIESATLTLAPDATEPTPVPAPALLPGLIILGFRAICKRGIQAKAVSAPAKT